MKFELFPRWTLRGRRYYWRIRALNGKITAQSEGYSNRNDAIKTINAIKVAAVSAPIVYMAKDLR